MADRNLTFEDFKRLSPEERNRRYEELSDHDKFLLTGAAVFAAIRLPQLQPLAAILPLFFPKVILLWQQVRPSARKGGEENGI